MNQTREGAAEIEAFSDRVLAPLVFRNSVPLETAVYQVPEPVPYALAIKAAYTPVSPGWRWGPVWSSAWFRLQGRVPDGPAAEWSLRFSSGTEATLWVDGAPEHGFDLNHEVAPLEGNLGRGGGVCLWVEAACNRPLGASTFFWDDAAEVKRWKEPLPGRFERAELVMIDREVWTLRHTLLFAGRLLKVLEGGPEAAALREACGSVIDRLGRDEPRRIAATATQELRDAMRCRGGRDDRTVCHAVGHAHIDTAWLWTQRETRRKCLRTFATAARLIDCHPGFNFLCSQAQQYAWLREESAALYERVRNCVLSGRWEPGGAMWVEPDANLPSGESFIRQILHGTRFWSEQFGSHGRQTYLYLPDTFGFPASLPQIIAQAGLRTFVTNKLGWNETNEFPHATFLWRGIDGTEVLSHCTPGMEYNATNTPAELRKGDANQRRRGGGSTGHWLQPFGYGDGGGGPTDWMILEAELAADCIGMPRVVLSRADAFCERLHERREWLESGGGRLPVWDGELYLERHRGTYTTQAWIKRANRLAEERLRVAEWLAVAGPRLKAEGGRDVAAALDRAWKLTLLNQFHDILPGSSIGEVYRESRAQYEEVEGACEAATRGAVGAWTGGDGVDAVVLNPCSTSRSGVVEHNGQLRWAAEVPGLGMAPLDGRAAEGEVRIDGGRLSNGVIEAEIDSAGRVRVLGCVGGARGLIAPGEVLNQLVLYDDSPKYWEAWDIDADYIRHAAPIVADAESWRIVESGPLRGAIEVERSLGKESRIYQRFVLDAGSPRLDVQTRIIWREHRRLLRVLFPSDTRSRNATCGIQFGHIQRPTHEGDPWAAAKFEVCAHRWVDLSEPGRGLAILSESKYGHSFRGGTIGLSLLRSTKFPDPDADMGEHSFVYSLMPHGGDWKAAGVDTEAEALNRPLFVVAGASGQAAWAPFRLTDGAGRPLRLEVPAVKPAEDGRRLIVRFVETRGVGYSGAVIAWGFPVRAVESVDVVEAPRPLGMLEHDAGAGVTRFSIRPFEIVTLAVERS